MNKSNVSQDITFCKYFLEPHSDVELTLQIAALSILGGFGVLGNVFTIVIATKYTARKNLHFLIVNMAVSDTLVIITIALFAPKFILSFKIWERYLADDFGCRVLPFLTSTGQTVSLISLMIISIERYRLTRRRAVQKSRPYSVKQRVSLVASSWLISIAVNLYEIVFNSSTDDGQCKVTSFGYYVWFSIKTFLTILLFLVLLVLSIRTLQRLSDPQAIEGHLSEAHRKLRRRRISSAVRVVLISLLLYSCCYLPHFIFQLVVSLTTLSPSIPEINWLSICLDLSSMVYMIQLFLPVANSSFSPCVYFVYLSDFRQAGKAVLCRESVTNDCDSIPTVGSADNTQSSACKPDE